jgi:integral membrane protein (TIGR01906 family)
MRVLSAFIVGLMLALFVVGAAILPMLHPAFTQLLASRYSLVAETGLPRQQVLSTAEQVRAFVAGSGADSLPAVVGGRPGFDAAAVSHLRDVRRVLGGAKVVTGVLGLLVAAWLGVAIARKWYSTMSAGFLVGAGFCAMFVLGGVAAGTMNFDSFFTWFHGLFFSAGTWEFPADSLLIQVFPIGFWMAAGVTWGVLVALGGVVLGTAGWLLRSTKAGSGEVAASAREVN